MRDNRFCCPACNVFSLAKSLKAVASYFPYQIIRFFEFIPKDFSYRNMVLKLTEKSKGTFKPSTTKLDYCHFAVWITGSTLLRGISLLLSSNLSPGFGVEGDFFDIYCEGKLEEGLRV